jgi:hypothetical protein
MSDESALSRGFDPVPPIARRNDRSMPGSARLGCCVSAACFRFGAMRTPQNGKHYKIFMRMGNGRRFFSAQPVLLATGYSDAAAEVAAEGFSILAKPYRADALADAIRTSLNIADRTRRNSA